MRIEKHKHWRGSTGIYCLEAAPVLDFGIQALAMEHGGELA